METFRQGGTVDWDRDRLKILVKIPASWSAQSFNTRPEMPSGPVAFLRSTACSMRLTSQSSSVRMKLLWAADDDVCLMCDIATSNTEVGLVVGNVLESLPHLLAVFAVQVVLNPPPVI